MTNLQINRLIWTINFREKNNYFTEKYFIKPN